MMIKNNLIYILMNLFDKGVGFLLLPIYSYYLSTSDFGIISLITLMLVIASTFSTSIMTNSMQRFYLSNNYNKKELLFLFLVLLSFLLFLISSFIFIFNEYIAVNFLDNKSVSTLVNYFILVLILSSYGELFTQTFILEQKASFISRIKIIKSIVLFIFTAVFFILDFGIYSIVYGMIISWIIFLILIYPSLKKHISVSTKFSLLKEPISYSCPLIIGSLSNNLIILGDRYIISIMLGINMVGIYSFAYTFSTIVSILLVIPNKLAMQPIILSKENNPKKLKYLLNRYATLFFTVGLICILWFSAFSFEFLSLISLNDDFVNGWIIIPIISFSYLLHGLGNYLGFGLVMAKKSWIVSFQTLIAAFVNVILNVFLITQFNLIGAAIATMLSYFVWNYLKQKNSEKYYNIHFNMRNINKLIVIGLITIFCIYFINHLNNYNIVLKILLLVIVSFLIFKKFVKKRDKVKINLFLKGLTVVKK